MTVLVNEATEPDAVCTAPRALIYLTVDWSVPERASRRAFFEAARQLSDEHRELEIAFYGLDEEAEAFRDFLASHGHKIARGCGSLIWLEAGRKVDAFVAGHLLGATGIVSRTLALWGNMTPTPASTPGITRQSAEGRSAAESGRQAGGEGLPPTGRP